MSKRKAPVLPGYYFDEAQNRYFKLEKSQKVDHHSSKPHSSKPNSSGTRSRLHPSGSSSGYKITCPWPGSLPALLRERALGNIPPPSDLFQRRAYQASACGYKKQVVTATCHRGTVTHLQLNDRQDMLIASANAGEGAALWRYRITRCDKFFIHVKRDENTFFSPHSHITDLNFVPQHVYPGSVALVSQLGSASIMAARQTNYSNYCSLQPRLT